MSKLDRAIAENHLYLLHKHIIVNGNVETKINNLFVITGLVRIYSLYGYVEEAALAADVTDCYLDLFPTGGAAVELTKIVGAPAMSDFEVGSAIVKSQEAGQIASVLRANVGMFLEEDTDYKKVAKPFIVGKDSDAVTQIRFVYTTGADLSLETAQVHFHATWQPLSDDGDLVAA